MHANSGDTSADWAALTAICGVLGIAAATMVGTEVLALADIIATLVADTGSRSGG